MYWRPPLHSWRSPSFRYADFLSWLWTFQGIHISSVAAIVQSSQQCRMPSWSRQKTIYKGRSCSMHFSWSCHRQKIMSTVLQFERKPHCQIGYYEYEYEYLYFGNIYIHTWNILEIYTWHGNEKKVYDVCSWKPKLWLLPLAFRLPNYDIYIYITSLIETSRLMLIKIK